jgi:uncharacterized protein (TIGR03067 family)
MRAALLAVGLVILATADGTGQDKKEVKLDGTYIIVGLEFGGEKIPAEFIEKAPEAERTIKIEGNKLIASKGGKDDAATFKTDTTKTPHHIDITSKKGDKEEVGYGIFKLDGDTLTIVANDGAKADDRPKEFKTEKNSKSILMVLKKKKDK